MAELVPDSHYCQHILEDQGYLVVWSKNKRSVGEIINELDGGFGYPNIPGPMIIVGPATCLDFETQLRKTGEWLHQDKAYLTHCIRNNIIEFWKVVAE